jgi:chemotaxis protein MotA
VTQKKTIDRSTLGGILVASVGIVVGLLLDGGSLRQIVQPTAAFIVFGGTLGAVMVQFPLQTLRHALVSLKQVFLEPGAPTPASVEVLLGYANKARRRGLIALDADLKDIEDPFLRKCLTCAVDGMQKEPLRELMQIDLAVEEEKAEGAARVLESAGGFSPTVGILGAVLGLIQVMQRLDNIGEVGKGIAVAFVATLYGVGSANLLFLPLAGKMRIRARETYVQRELMLEAALSIADGTSPRALRDKLTAHLEDFMKPKPVSTVAIQ